MNTKLPVPALFGLLLTSAAWPQTPPATHGSVPIYTVTVVERTVKSVNYQYRSGPTPIDFRGTVLLPQAKGDALVESKAGRVEIDARFDHLAAPSRFGAEYLTYVLWAITPEGHAKNLGEIMSNSSDHGHLKVTTDLQAFGLIVTAEPYSAVRQPSDVVVAENEVRPDTIGRIEPIMAKYELMPRGHYTYNVPADLKAAEQGPKVSMSEYESLLEVYQAQNAVQIAQSQHADQYAPETYQRAAQLLREAQQLQASKAGRSQVVTTAREAAQTAEDARLITTRRQQDETLATARQQASDAQAAQARAEAQLQQTRAEAASQADRTAAEQAQAAPAVADQTPPPAPTTQPVIQDAAPSPQPGPPIDAAKADLRVRLLRQMAGSLPALDTPRGLVVTVPDNGFNGRQLLPEAAQDISRVAQAIAAQPGLNVEVDGYTDEAAGSTQTENASYERAAAVREELVRMGLPANRISARGMGASRPVTSNATPDGRAQNRRVEILVTGAPIGAMAHWDRTYTINPRQ